MSFQHLNLIEPLLKALDNEGYTTPTPIQQQAIPHLLNRQDLLGCAQTGTGKTAAFSLPILQLMCEDMAGIKEHTISAAVRPISALILTPTRELAIQIGDSIAAYGRHTGIRHLVIFGGVPQHAQVQALQKGTDILIATPGRLLDLMDQRFISLKDIRYFVLDEADRMLDMGFIHDVRKVLTKLPPKRQSLFFSATMPPEIQKLADTILVNPAKVEVTPVSSTAETIQQSIYFVEKKDKRSLLLHILKSSSIPTALVFTRTKHGADKVAQGLTRAGIRAEAIHGNKSQNARQRALHNFKNRQTRILVATDIAARGIDIDELTHVINFELPNVPETYVHRIGRTGRAGANGTALSFCDAEEKEYLRDIQKLIARQIPVVEDHPHAMHGGSLNTAVPAAGSGPSDPSGNNRRNDGRSNPRREGGNQQGRSNNPGRNGGQQQGRNNASQPGRGGSQQQRRDGNQNNNSRSADPARKHAPVQPLQNEQPIIAGDQDDFIEKRIAEQQQRKTVEQNQQQRPPKQENQQDVEQPAREKRPEQQLSPEKREKQGALHGGEKRPEQRKVKPNPGQMPSPAFKKDVKASTDDDFPFQVNQSAGDERW